MQEEKGWIVTSKKQPRRFENVWISRKGKAEIAYLDIEKIPQWHLLKTGKTIAYNKVDAWMPVTVPVPFGGE